MSFSSGKKSRRGKSNDAKASKSHSPSQSSLEKAEKKIARKPQKLQREIRVNRFTQKAEYDGRTKYEKPRYAYHYNYKYRHLDTTLPITQVAYQWFKDTQRNSLQFLLDLTFRGDIDAVMFKVAGFTKRNVERTLNLMKWLGAKTYNGW